MDVETNVRHSASWGCHGLYNIARIDFLAPSHNSGDSGGDEKVCDNNIAHSPFMKDEKQEIKGGLEK